MTTGVKLNDPVIVDPNETSAFTLISGYLNVWKPEPWDSKPT